MDNTQLLYQLGSNQKRKQKNNPNDQCKKSASM